MANELGTGLLTVIGVLAGLAALLAALDPTNVPRDNLPLEK